MRSASAWAPFVPLLPKKPTCTQAVLSPSWQNSQVPSEIANGITTRFASLDSPDVSTGLLDDSDRFLAHALPALGWRHRVVWPQVAAAEASADDAHDRVGGLDDPRVGDVLDPHVAGAVHDGCAHQFSPAIDGALLYCSSLTCSPQATTSPASFACCSATWVMNRVGAAPCQWFSPGSKKTRSPGRMTSTGPPSRWHRPTPSVTQIVCPFGCVCHAVRAPGVKCTQAAPTREASDGAAMVSTYTAPVNQSFGPVLVSRLFLVICTRFSSRCLAAPAKQQPSNSGARLRGLLEHPACLALRPPRHGGGSRVRMTPTRPGAIETVLPGKIVP